MLPLLAARQVCSKAAGHLLMLSTCCKVVTLLSVSLLLLAAVVGSPEHENDKHSQLFDPTDNDLVQPITRQALQHSQGHQLITQSSKNLLSQCSRQQQWQYPYLVYVQGEQAR